MSIKKIILCILALLLVMAALGIGAYFYIQKQVLLPLDLNGAEKIFAVENGENIGSIASNLEKDKLIKNSFYFKFYFWQNKGADKIKAGKYLLAPKMAIGDIAEVLTQGKMMPEGVWVTIPEGLTIKEIDEKFAQSGLVKKGAIINYKFDSLKNKEGKDILDLLLGISADDPASYDFLKDKPEKAGLEGFLFPDSYRFREGAAADVIIVKMLDNFNKKLDNDLRQAINDRRQAFKNGNPLTIFEAITMASIIQKEVRTPEDMKMVAGIFYNRLNTGMKLEADSTLNFITDSHRDRATYEDLRIDSLYNTYKYAGLPPGPISNPGLEAIKAAVYPAKTDYFYFLTASGGQVIYSKTYAEHLKNIAKWLN